MAMLFLNAIFARTWGESAGPLPTTEYWADMISAIKKNQAGFVFVAEAYWDLEWDLQQQGFDFCYDKKLYDRLAHGNAESVRLHLCADLAYQSKLVRFIENHDEPRASATFSREKQRAVALVTATLPGIKLFHEGQLEGRRVRLPVFLDRRPDEPLDRDLCGFYQQLLELTNRPVFREGRWHLCERTGWPDNTSFRNLLAWSWLADDERYVIVVNLSEYRAQARVQVPWADAGRGTWRLIDGFSRATHDRDAGELVSPGLYVDLGPWNYHFFKCLHIGKF
jgi:hypothetical protein